MDPRSTGLGKKTLAASLLALFLVLAFFEFTNADIFLGEFFYDYSLKAWALKDPTLLYRAIFYDGIKIPIYLIGVMALIASLISLKTNKWPEYRKGLFIVTLTLIILPLFVSVGGKNITNVHCPYQVDHFNGLIPYVKLFDHMPKNPLSPDGKYIRGYCYPAGHASGGFALLGLVCFFRERRNKILAFIFAMTTGWTMAMYQMLRGAHFLSHSLVTMILAFILVSTLNLLLKDFNHDAA